MCARAGDVHRARLPITCRLGHVPAGLRNGTAIEVARERLERHTHLAAAQRRAVTRHEQIFVAPPAEVSPGALGSAVDALIAVAQAGSTMETRQLILDLVPEFLGSPVPPWDVSGEIDRGPDGRLDPEIPPLMPWVYTTRP